MTAAAYSVFGRAAPGALDTNVGSKLFVTLGFELLLHLIQ